MNFRSSIGVEEEGFQLAPLIDIVFLLLVFFIVTSALKQIELQTDLAVPTSDTGKLRQTRPHPYYINVTREGTILVRNRPFTVDQLRAWLKDLSRSYKDSPPPIIIRADRDAAFQHFVKVFDACAEADIRNVAFANVDNPPQGG
jgi:biopolymer transport protein ExbD